MPFPVVLSVRIVVVLLALLLGARAAAAAPDPCTAGLARALGTHVAGALTCEAKAAKTGTTTNALCAAKADAKLLVAFGQLEQNGCGPGEASSALAANGSFVSTVVARLRTGSGPDACAGKKLAATGVKARGKLRCQALAAKKGTALDPACMARVERRFTNAFTRLDAKGGCLTFGDAAIVEADVDAFVVAALAKPPCADLIETDLPNGWSVDPDEFTTTLSALGAPDALFGNAALRADTD